MSGRPVHEENADEPATLCRVMQEAIGAGLKNECDVPRIMPHSLLVLLMQMNAPRRKHRTLGRA
jgi:hypothetical protein